MNHFSAGRPSRNLNYSRNGTIEAMKTSPRGIALIKESEHLELTAYLCPAGVWTVGYGHTVGVKKSDRITEAQAEKLLVDDLAIYEAGVQSVVKVPLTQGQFDALVSFALNAGVGALRGSTLLKKLNAGDIEGAANEFGRWVNGGGKKLKGLVIRREKERELFLAD